MWDNVQVDGTTTFFNVENHATVDCGLPPMVNFSD